MGKDPVHVTQGNDPETFSRWHFAGNESTDVQVTDTEELFHLDL